jgi:hypothetical protein
MAMQSRNGVLALLLASALFAQDIHLKSRTLKAPADAHPVTDQTPRHWMIQFDHAPGAEEIDALLQDGLEVVSALPDNAVMVGSVSGAIPARPGRQLVGTLQPVDKLSADLDETDDPILALVEFHSDVTADQQDAVAQAEGLTLQRTAFLRADHAIVSAFLSDLAALTQHDEVAYIFPADPRLLEPDADLMPCPGMLTSSGPVGQYANIVHGWDLSSDNIAHLGYFFSSVTPKVPSATVQSEVIRALNEWTKHANIQFTPSTAASAPRTVVVKFVSGAHGDSWPFDGPGGVLGHTFYPVPVSSESIAGDMHLDADENWHAGGDVDIYSVALHEAGHAIGLGHSDKIGDVMYPYYRNGRPLSANDIGAVQALYGAVTGPGAQTTPSPVTPPIAPAPALRITLDPVPPSTQSPSFSVSGTVSGGTGPWTVQWATGQGYAGRATVIGTAFTAAGITLVAGTNSITFTTFDSAHVTASQTVSVTLAPATPAPPSGGAPISISVSSPASSVTTVSASTLTVSGQASGGGGINRITWVTGAGASGIATGTGTWVAQGIPLLVGTNNIILRAWDDKGYSAWVALVVVRH